MRSDETNLYCWLARCPHFLVTIIKHTNNSYYCNLLGKKNIVHMITVAKTNISTVLISELEDDLVFHVRGHVIMHVTVTRHVTSATQ